MGVGGGVEQVTGGKGNVNGSFGSLSEEGDLHNSVPVLEGVAVTVVVAFMREGAVNVLEQDSLRETRSLVSCSLMTEWPHVMNTAPIELERDSVESKVVYMYMKRNEIISKECFH
jgi:hypothetical protein